MRRFRSYSIRGWRINMSDKQTTDTAEWTGYINGLVRSGNLKPRIPFGAEGANVLNDIRDQIDSEIKRAEERRGY